MQYRATLHARTTCKPTINKPLVNNPHSTKHATHAEIISACSQISTSRASEAQPVREPVADLGGFEIPTETPFKTP